MNALARKFHETHDVAVSDGISRLAGNRGYLGQSPKGDLAAGANRSLTLSCQNHPRLTGLCRVLWPGAQLNHLHPNYLPNHVRAMLTELDKSGLAVP